MNPWRAALTSATASGKSTRIASRSAIACSSAPPVDLDAARAPPRSARPPCSASASRTARAAPPAPTRPAARRTRAGRAGDPRGRRRTGTGTAFHAPKASASPVMPPISRRQQPRRGIRLLAAVCARNRQNASCRWSMHSASRRSPQPLTRRGRAGNGSQRLADQLVGHLARCLQRRASAASRLVAERVLEPPRRRADRSSQLGRRDPRRRPIVRSSRERRLLGLLDPRRAPRSAAARRGCERSSSSSPPPAASSASSHTPRSTPRRARPRGSRPAAPSPSSASQLGPRPPSNAQR